MHIPLHNLCRACYLHLSELQSSVHSLCISQTFPDNCLLNVPFKHFFLERSSWLEKKRIFFPSYVYFISCSRMWMESTPVIRGVKDFASFLPLKHHRATLTVTLSEILQTTVVHTWSPKLECKPLGWLSCLLFFHFVLSEGFKMGMKATAVSCWVGGTHSSWDRFFWTIDL